MFCNILRLTMTSMLAVFCTFSSGCFRNNPEYEDENTDSDTDTDADSDTDIDTDSDIDADTDSDSDSDADTDSDVYKYPEINVFQGKEEYLNDESEYVFDSVEYDGDGNTSSADVPFSIRNKGDADLIVSQILIYGDEADDFELAASNEEFLIPPGNSSIFYIRFDPLGLDQRTATVSISNNDENENPFRFTVSGNGVDTTSPTVENGLILATGIDHYGMTLSWDPAWDFVTNEKNLEYLAYVSDNPDIDTLENAEKHGTSIGNWSENTTTVEVSNLVPGTLNYFNVFVRDEAFNNSGYSVLAQETIHPIYLYSVHVDHGNLGGREGADGICTENLPATMSATTVKAFLSVSESDEIRDLPDDPLAPLPTDRILSGFPYSTVNVIADNFGSLWESGPSVSLQDAGIAPSAWMSGSNTDGSLAQNCDGWSTEHKFATVAVGSHTNIDSGWIYWITGYCSQNDRAIVCIAWD